MSRASNLEQQILASSRDIDRLRNLAQTRRSAAKARLDALKAEGRNPLTDKGLFAELEAEFRAADEAAEQAAEADKERSRLMGAWGGPGMPAPIGPAANLARGRGLAAAGSAMAEAVVQAVTVSAGPGAYMASLTPSGAVTVPALSSSIVRDGERPTSLIELVPFEGLEGTDSWSYLRETVRTHGAATVAPGALKPTSTYSVEKIDRKTDTVAHLSEPIERQTLSDVTLLRQYVEGSLAAGVMLELERQILFGAGPNITGLAVDAAIQSQTWDANFLRTARLAVVKLERAEIDPSRCAFVMSPEVWASAELTRAGAQEDGEFLVDDNRVPVDRARRQLWGVPVVTSTAVAVDHGEAYLVDFAGSTTAREREGVRVDWSENTYDPDALGAGVGASDFSRNLIRFRGEGRFGFAVTRPKGVVQFPTVAPV